MITHDASRPRIASLWWAHGIAAFTVLLLFKLAAVGNQVFGTEAYASLGNLASKLPLLLGRDVLGAVVVGLLIAVVSCGMCRLHPLVGHGVGALLQGAHGLLAAVSFYTTLYVGGPLTKTVLDLAMLQEHTPNPTASQPALWSSVSRYLGTQQISVMLGAVALGMFVAWRSARRDARLSSGARRGLTAIGVGLVLTTLGVLPWLINGHLAGIRVHTYGLERSAGVDLMWSYARPLLARIGTAEATEDEGFVLDMATRTFTIEDNPLLGAVAPRNNVILVSLESVGAVYLDDPEVMPFISGLDRRPDGLTFSQHYATWPQTMKSFFSVFCAELPYPDYQTISMVNPAIPCVSVSEALARAGYFTALVTSADLGYDRKMRFFQHRAFEHIVDMHSLPHREEYWSNSWGVDEKVAVRHILDLARESRDRPFFVFYELFTAHHPYDAAQEHVDAPLADDRAAYLRALRYIDDRMRELVEGLERAGRMKDTLVVFFADHGEGFGQHPGSVSHGSKIYQETVLVPMALVGPPVRGRKGPVRFPTSHIDIAPTLLGLVGVAPPCTMKGRDLTRSSEARFVFFGGRPPGGQMGLVDGPWKYILNENGLEELYRIDKDPGEKRDLAGDERERLAPYRRRIERWRRFSTGLIEGYAERLAKSDCRP